MHSYWEQNLLNQLLHCRELNTDDEFALGWNVFANIGFHSAKHVWCQHVMQLQYLLIFRYLRKLRQKLIHVPAA